MQLSILRAPGIYAEDRLPIERLRDGKSYSTRRVTAIQHGNAIFSIMVSFHVEEHGSFDHQDKMPDVPPPEA